MAVGNSFAPYVFAPAIAGPEIQVPIDRGKIGADLGPDFRRAATIARRKAGGNFVAVARKIGVVSVSVETLTGHAMTDLDPSAAEQIEAMRGEIVGEPLEANTAVFVKRNGKSCEGLWRCCQ